MKLAAATPLDSDYAYIQTFIQFLSNLGTVINDLFSGFIDNLGKLLGILNTEE
jgi:hypothetical protein